MVYNEARFIEETMASLLAQDYANLEIICCDNHSSDRSADVCRRAAAADSRVRYLRHDENIGAPANSIFALGEAQGKYFMWASGHDTWARDLVSRCVDALERRPTAAIAVGSSTWIDVDGNELEKEAGWYDTRGLDPMLRFFFRVLGKSAPDPGFNSHVVPAADPEDLHLYWCGPDPANRSRAARRFPARERNELVPATATQGGRLPPETETLYE